MSHHDGDLSAVIARTRNLFLDFDGPVCAIFANYPAPDVAAQLRQLLKSRGATITPDMSATDDPLHLLRLSAEHADEATTQVVAHALRDAEVTAAASAQPTPDADEVIAAALDTGRQLAIVSNNSTEAVTAYLRRHDLLGAFTRVIARYPGMNPALLKPSSHLIGLALTGMDAPPWSSTLLGDSTSDIQAARSVPIASIGYADHPTKAPPLTLAGADAIITRMGELADALRTTPIPHTPHRAG